MCLKVAAAFRKEGVWRTADSTFGLETGGTNDSAAPKNPFQKKPLMSPQH